MRSVRWLSVATSILGLSGAASEASDLRLPVGGRVTVEFLAAKAKFRNTLTVVSPRAAIEASGCQPEAPPDAPGRPILTGAPSQSGCRVTLDADAAADGVQPFPAGTVFRFGLCVQTDGDPQCDLVWSSSPARNADGADHLCVQTDADPDCDPVRASDRIFRLTWEDQDQRGPTDRDFDDLIAVLRIEGDQDGDGLWDDWETAGIDSDGDGRIDHRLPGATPDHKDVFVELDWMDCALTGGDCVSGDRHQHRPPDAAIRLAQQVYADAPVANPDGTPGVRLHVELGNAVRHRRFLDLGCFGSSSFAAVKAASANFGLSNPRRFTHHYAIVGHEQSPLDRGMTGCAELPGNDFLITVADRLALGHDSIRAHASALLHELGHNLGLDHGGADEVDGKPNYLSVMNHSYEVTGLPPSGLLDYSREALPDLDEASLTDRAVSNRSMAYVCPDLRPHRAPAGRLIDWNCDGDTDDTHAQLLDVNGDRFCVRPALGAPLQAVPEGDDELIDVPAVPRLGFPAETWIADGPDRVCDTAAVATDEQLRPRGHTQPTLLSGSSDWDRLRYPFQATRGYRGGAEVTSDERPRPQPFPSLADLGITEFRTVPAGTVPAGSMLVYVAGIENADASPVPAEIELQLPLQSTFESCQVAAPGAASAVCRETATGLVRADGFEVSTEAVTLTVVVRVSGSATAGTLLSSTVTTRVEGDPDCREEFSCEGEAEAPPNTAMLVVTVSPEEPACAPGLNVIVGTPGDDVLVGTNSNDCILGREGNDTLVGGEGDDLLIGGPGLDILSGGPGHDRLVGGDGNDQLDGGDGDDVLEGGPGNDQLNGGRGNDQLDGGPGTDSCLTGGSSGDRRIDCEP